jgi:Rrf2 family protein
MLKLSKKIEYGLLAAQYIASHPGKLVSAKEMSDELNISFEFLAKTLQKLMKSDLVVSYQGIKGGYELARKPDEISMADIITALEGNPTIVDCVKFDGSSECGRSGNCSIKKPMGIIQKKINNILSSTTIAEITA